MAKICGTIRIRKRGKDCGGWGERLPAWRVCQREGVMGDMDHSNAGRARRQQRENEEQKERLYEEEMRKERERRGVFRFVMAVLGGLFALNFLMPYLLGLHQSGYTFLRRAVERESLKKAWGTPAEPHILLEADVWEEAYIKQVEEMGVVIGQRTVEQNVMVEKGGIFGTKYDEEIHHYELADGGGKISIARDIKGNDLIFVEFYETGEASEDLILAALALIGRQQGYPLEESELERWKSGGQSLLGSYRNIQISLAYRKGYPDGVSYTLTGAKDTSVMEPDAG